MEFWTPLIFRTPQRFQTAQKTSRPKLGIPDIKESSGVLDSHFEPSLEPSTKHDASIKQRMRAVLPDL
jgi:hypothetical protein